MRYKISFLISLVFLVNLLAGCTFLQDLKQVAQNNLDYLNENVQASSYYPYVEFGEGIDTNTGTLYSQGVNNTFTQSSLTDLYARAAILATNQNTFSLVYKIKLGRTEIESGTITGNLTAGTVTNYIALIVPVRNYGFGTYTVDFYDSSDTLRAIASGSCTIQQK